MAKFETGHKKRGGRTKGTENKVTSQTREFFKMLLEKNEKKIQRELNGLTGREFLDQIFKMAEYVLPKLARTELTGQDGKGIVINMGFGIESINQSGIREGSE